ncbi:MAG: AraC family transcriptional regulator [Eubacteriales bacterium]|nr:AraC family transcriptional regulator [Eubacteriales bacterium]
MIRDLNRLSIAPYGELTEAPAYAPRKWEASGAPEGYFTCEQPVCVAFDSGGLSVLYVALGDGSAQDSFYLDKPVTLHPGVLFQLLPLEDQCTVQLFVPQDAALQLSPAPHLTPPERMTPQVEPLRIYTLFYQEKEKGFYFRGESHKQYELTYADSGLLHSVVDGQDLALSQGEMVLYGPWQWHMQYSEADRAACFVTISFDMDCDVADLLLNRKLQVPSTGAALLRRILEEKRGGDFLAADMILCYLKQFLLLMLRQVYRGVSRQKLETKVTLTSENALLDAALRYVGAHLEEKLTVSGVAKKVCVSTAYLSALFQKHLRTSPGEYIRREKLEESRRLIREGKLNFTQISQKLCYSSVQHFSNQFKARFGITPSEFSRSVG